MNAPISTSLDLMAAMAREGLNFFRYAQHHTDDPEVADAFRIAANVRALLLQDLHAAGAIPDPARDQPWPLDDDALSYGPLRSSFDRKHPERIALELHRRELALRLMVERVFREQRDLRVRQLMKSYLPAVQSDTEMWVRLTQRAAAAA